MRGLTVLGLGSLISQVVFLTYLFWHRATVTHLHGECRRLILALAHTQLTPPARPEPGPPVTAGVPVPGTPAHPAIPTA